MVHKKTDKLALRLGIDDLKCSSGWLDRFKVRHGISCQKIVCEKRPLSRYQPHDVYNADEQGMFYNLTADHTLAVKGDMCKDMKRCKKYLTVLLCCNMDGSDKMKPLVASRLGRENGNANRKVVLFVDNCAARPEFDNLRNIKLVYQLKNTTSMLQPLDQGIIQHVKLKFQEMHVRSIVLKMEIGKEMKNFEDTDDPPPVDAEPIPHPSTVPLSARLTVTRPCDEETWRQLAPDCTFEEFVIADDDIAVWSTLDYADDVQGQQELSGEEEHAQVPTMRQILKARDDCAAMLRGHGENKEMW
ncbi:hypothetical protein PR048_018774 [Dryococelus australis]|uniref:HTH CENPB-type domain-containing protein n=1 Tax=Dryococelus australis TaxID=614101 RepID=A0ABQ9HD86_9NEOP|nr:hypothetical protein PR048_018774 [Dryococelus australis]